MGKILSLLITNTALLIGISHNNGATNIVPQKETVVKKTVYETLDSLLLSQLYIREATGKNDGKEVEAFLKSVDRKKGDSWCAAYVSYDLQFLKQRGYNVDYIKSGWSPSFASNKYVIWKKGSNFVPFKMGDVFTIYFPSLKRAAHTGFIYRDETNSVITVEGNTSEDNYGQKTRDGNGVFKKRRLKKQLYTIARFIKNE